MSHKQHFFLHNTRWVLSPILGRLDKYRYTANAADIVIKFGTTVSSDLVRGGKKEDFREMFAFSQVLLTPSL